ncbi:mannose-6-phosphate isomerase, class I [Nocardioides marinquilinus]
MRNPVRDYAWGSTTRLARFLDRTPTGDPEAELWIGAHEGDPSLLPDGRRLDEAIADDPAALLGDACHDDFGGRLPFLMKVLAVDRPLSLQVHPSAEQARRGHEREDGAGLALGAPQRNYKDPWHKPELLVALTEFEGLAGFRDPAASARLLRLLDAAWSAETAGRLEREPLRDVVTDTLRLGGETLVDVVREVGEQARLVAGTAEGEAARTLSRVGELALAYPGDAGVLVALLLNNVLLAPGEAMFVDAGVVHAYFGGFGLEIMASSDNVLRAGLTPKHMDVAELLSVTDLRAVPPPRWEPAERGPDHVVLRPPVAEFVLTVGRPPLRDLPATGPRVVLALEGEVTVSAAHERLTLRRGEAAFVAHADGAVVVEGDGRVAVGSVPE